MEVRTEMFMRTRGLQVFELRKAVRKVSYGLQPSLDPVDVLLQGPLSCPAL